jgi:23S rRNA (adenine1618-N6)-methyltransferase
MKEEKNNLHSNNLHRFRYDFDLLKKHSEDLATYLFVNEHGIESIDFSDPNAVKSLNKALLFTYYNITFWDLPNNYLCPPIPGRADYLHYIADLIAESNNNFIPMGSSISVLDIGVGANCIYPILGNALFGWSFVASDIDEKALQNCVEICNQNQQLADNVSFQLQPNARFIFKDIILSEDRFTFTICNPPFHKSAAEAANGSIRKINNLENTSTKTPKLNFGGQSHELWCDGGELAFITQMIFESAKYPMHCFWFTTLVSKQSHISSLEKVLNKVNVVTFKIINIAQGQKISRILAWTFLSESQQKQWKFTED